MTPGETAEEYRAAFFQTFAEDHGLINEWIIQPPLSPVTPMNQDARLIGGGPPGTNLGMILSGS
jgi:hypothetical protein